MNQSSRPLLRALPLVVIVLVLCGIATFGVVRLISVEIEDAAGDTTAALVVNTATPTVEVQQPTVAPTEVVVEAEPTAVPPRPTRDIKPVFGNGAEVADDVEEAEEAPVVEEPAAEVDPAPEVEETAPEPEMVSDPEPDVVSAPERGYSVADYMYLQVEQIGGSDQLAAQAAAIPGVVSVTNIRVPAGSSLDPLPTAQDFVSPLDGAQAVDGNTAALSLNASNVGNLPSMYSYSLPNDWRPANGQSEFTWGAPYGTNPSDLPLVTVPTAGQIQLSASNGITPTVVDLHWVYMPQLTGRNIDGYDVEMLLSHLSFQLWNNAIDNDLVVADEFRYHRMYGLWTNKDNKVSILVRYTYPDGRVGCYVQNPVDNTKTVFQPLQEGEWCSGWSAEMTEGVIIDLRLMSYATSPVNFDLGPAGEPTDQGIYPPMVAANQENLHLMLNELVGYLEANGNSEASATTEPAVVVPSPATPVPSDGYPAP